jgi:hypothetical protein
MQVCLFVIIRRLGHQHVLVCCCCTMHIAFLITLLCCAASSTRGISHDMMMPHVMLLQAETVTRTCDNATSAPIRPGSSLLGSIVALSVLRFQSNFVSATGLLLSCFLSHSFRCALVLLLLCQRPSHMYLSKPLRLLLNAAPSRSSPAHRCSMLFVVARHRCLMLLTTRNHIPVRVDRCGAGNHALPYKARVAPRDDC